MACRKAVCPTEHNKGRVTWAGFKIGVGIALGILAIVVIVRLARRVLREISGSVVARRFVSAGFTWEENPNVCGWLTRDPNNGEWILWDEKQARMFRSSDNDSRWRVSSESRQKCLELGRQYLRSSFE